MKNFLSRALCGWIFALVLLGLAAVPDVAAGAPALALTSDIEQADTCADLTWHPATDLPAGAVARVLDRLGAFEPPPGPCGNYGLQADGVWLKLPLAVAADAVRRRWYLEIDYAPLHAIDVHLLRGGRPAWHAELGDRLPHDERPTTLRPHSVLLPLDAPGEWTLLIRVQSSGGLIAPVRLLQEPTLLVQEERIQLMQGLLAGMALMLAFFGILHSATLRDGTYLFYAVQVLSMCLFFLAFSGLGAQHLWPEAGGWSAHAVRLSVLAGLAANAVFADRVLELARVNGALSRALRWLALGCAVAAATLAVGVLPGVLAHRIILVVVPAAMLLLLGAGVAALRDRQAAARWVLAGWASLAAGVFVVVGVQWGLVQSNYWTLNAYQFGIVIDMLAWLRVIGLHDEQLRIAADLARRERDTLECLAHSDPLTGALNRRGLERLGNGLIAQAGPDALVALFLVDLDDFKLVNDRFGHEAGDVVLVEMTRRVRQQLRSADLVARLGGDEFVVVAASLASPHAARRLATKIAHAMGAPMRVRGQQIVLRASIGQALAPDEGADCATLIGLADDAMYRHKRQAKSDLFREVREQV